ncbi:MAG: DNA/RNA non-specific endonuclease [Bacteroidetes bacterium]|nr:DNA/RNA non-specific endonuclease [Bacteroidota bacterium]MCL1968613.1 DNA/RNA non-specific endonuclease [Bacteroidota bacterium]
MKYKFIHFTTFISILVMCLLGSLSFSCVQQPVPQNQQATSYQDTIVHPDTISVNWILPYIELPEVKNIRWFIQHQYYAMEYDTAQRHSVWVAYKFYSDYNLKTVKRTDAWALDPDIPKEFQSLNGKTQTYPGYDRGHLIASEDRVFNLEANQETFYFSNMSPQLGCFNQKIWKYLEEAVRKWAQASDCDTLYVATGGAINPGVEILGKLEERNHVTIPKYYFKALVKRQGDSFTGIAFWLENKCYTDANNKSLKITHEYSMTIRELEEKTGINFFPYLRDIFPNRPNLEEEVETSRDITKWPL